jgi:hypothetical protein
MCRFKATAEGIEIFFIPLPLRKFSVILIIEAIISPTSKPNHCLCYD